jgi:uncharacterized protein (DUF779 family)
MQRGRLPRASRAACRIGGEKIEDAMTTIVSRVAVTDAAAALLRQLTAQHGPLMFHQSGGCCDGSAPMCYPVGMFLTGPSDVKLGDLDVGLDDEIEVFISEAQFEYWKYTHLTIDVVPGRGRASASKDRPATASSSARACWTTRNWRTSACAER